MNALQLIVMFSTTRNSSTASSLHPIARHWVYTLLVFAVLIASARTALGQSSGAADPTWSITPLPLQSMAGIAVQPGGKVVAVGRHVSLNEVNIYRFDFTGNLDASFGAGGKVVTKLGLLSSSVSHMAIDSSGRIYVAGRFTDPRPHGSFGPDISGFAVMRLHADGLLDYSFGSYGFSKIPLNDVTIFEEGMPISLRNIAFQPDGKLLFMASGYEATAPAGVQSIVTLRFDTNGKLDPAFADGGLSLIRMPGNNGSPTVIRVAKNGSIFVAGSEEDQSRGFVLKLTAQGNVDPAFGTAGKVSSVPGIDKFSLTELAIQNDNKIIVAGRRWRTVGSPEEDGILALRLNADGSLDTGFGNGGYSFYNPSPDNDYALDLTLEPGGNILIAGSSTTGGPTPQGNPVLIRLTPNGQFDPNFAGTGIIIPPGLSSFDLEVFDAAYLLIRNLQFPTSSDNNLFSLRKFITQTPTVEPQVAITGGNKTIADTDGVAGEVVTVTGTATDSDGTIVHTDWVLNGVPAATGQNVLLSLKDGTNVITYTALDNSSAKATAMVTYNVLAPTVPLPRINAESSHGDETFDTQFSIAIRNASNALVTTAPITQPLTMTGYIFPREGYKNFGADIFVVAATSFGWFMRNVDGEFVPWNRDLASLAPAYINQLLSEPARVPMYAGQLPLPGLYQMFIGFRIQESSEIIYSLSAGSVTITAP